jgi:hypothetical protein
MFQSGTCNLPLFFIVFDNINMPHFSYVWTNATDGHSSHLRIFNVTNHQACLKELGTVALEKSHVRTVQFVPGMSGGLACSSSAMEEPLRADMVWVGTDTKT